MRSLSVLVVDDEPEVCDALSETLKHAFQNVNCILSNDGVDSLQKMERQQFDFVILDLGLPRMNGVSVMKSLGRLDPRLRPKHLVCLSGYEPDPITKEIMRDLDVDFLRKPCRSEDILGVLRKHIDAQFPDTASVSIESSFVGAVLEAVLRVAQNALLLTIEKESLHVGQRSISCSSSVVLQAIGIQHQGLMVISFPKESLQEFTKRRHPAHSSVSEAEMKSFLTDFSSAVFFQAKKILSEKGFDYTAGLPFVVMGDHHEILSGVSTPGMVVEMTTDLGPFRVEIGLRRNS